MSSIYDLQCFFSSKNKELQTIKHEKRYFHEIISLRSNIETFHIP